jgi:hypothetical protein
MFYSSSSNGENKEPETHVRSVSTEEYREKEGDKPEEVRKYGELYKRDNDDDGLLKQKASTNVDVEQKLLGNGEKMSMLNRRMEKDHFEDFNSHFDNFFDNDVNKPFPHIGRDFGHFDSFENSFNNHGKYGNFLNEKAQERLSNH